MEESDPDASESDPLVTKDSSVSEFDQRQRKDGVKGKKKTEGRVSFDIKKEQQLHSDQKTDKSPHLPTDPNYSISELPEDSGTLPSLSDGNDEPCMEEVHLPLRNKLIPPTEEPAAVLCPFFGVKNYLHYFYEKPDLKNTLYLMDGNEEAFLIKHREGACNSQVFRLSLILGGLILIVGSIAFVVAMCSSRRVVLEGKVGGITVVDKVAAAHNSEMDALLLVSLLAVTIGATIVAAALISKTFCSGQEYDEAFRVGITSMCKHSALIHHIEKGVPVTEQLTSIQPWSGPIYITPKYPPCHE